MSLDGEILSRSNHKCDRMFTCVRVEKKTGGAFEVIFLGYCYSLSRIYAETNINGKIVEKLFLYVARFIIPTVTSASRYHRPLGCVALKSPIFLSCSSCGLVSHLIEIYFPFGSLFSPIFLSLYLCFTFSPSL